MGAVIYKGVDRRCFLKDLGAAGLLLTLGSGRDLLGQTKEKSLHWAFFSDTHIPRDQASAQPSPSLPHFGPWANLQQVSEEVVAAKVQTAIVTGDLARLEGLPGDYRKFTQILSPLSAKMPLVLGLGNHDNRVNFNKIITKTGGVKQAVSGKFVTVVDTGIIRLIVLDSLFFVNKAAGLLGKAQRDWLAGYLEKTDKKPTLLCFHHTVADGDGDLLDVPRLYTIIKPLRQVKGLIFGHSHTYGFTKYEDIHLINLPAVGYSFAQAMPVGWVETKLTARDGEFKLHVVNGPGTMDGKVTRLIWRV